MIRFCQTVRRISPSPRSRATAARPRICSTVILPTGSTTPIQFKPGCFCGCTPIWAARSKAGRGSSASPGTRSSLRPSFSSTSASTFSSPRRSMTYLSRALVRSVRSPWSMNTRTMASATLVASAGFTTTPVSRAKSWCPVMPPIIRRNQMPRSSAETVLHRDRLEADVVGVLQHRNDAAAVEADIELARQAVERALVEDVEMPFARVGRGCRSAPADRCPRSASP